MTQGLVLYTPNEGADACPAILLKEWEDGMIQLYAFGSEGPFLVRAAHPSLVRTIRPEDAEDNEILVARIEALETEAIELRLICDQVLNARDTGETEEHDLNGATVSTDTADRVVTTSKGKAAKKWAHS